MLKTVTVWPAPASNTMWNSPAGFLKEKRPSASILPESSSFSARIQHTHGDAGGRCAVGETAFAGDAPVRLVVAVEDRRVGLADRRQHSHRGEEDETCFGNHDGVDDAASPLLNHRGYCYRTAS